MTYRIQTTSGGFTVSTLSEDVTIKHDGREYNASASRAVNASGKLCFVIEYRARLWSEEVFGEGDAFVVLNRAHKVIAKSPYLDEALRQAEAKL